MEPIIQVTYVLADQVIKGLTDGTLERFGGVIREVATGRVVTFLREVSSTVTSIPRELHMAKTALMVGSAASVLSLGVSVMGFALVIQRINELEQRIKQAEELLKKIDRKIDLGYYANFRTALDLAMSAFAMSKLENRRSSALQAINRFLEAEHIYTGYSDTELEQKSQIAEEYLLTLSLAYLAEARCHLELEENELALLRLQRGAEVVRSRMQEYIKLLLTPNPAVYLQPWYKGEIDLRRLTRIYQLLDPTLSENDVFEMQRQNFVNFVRDPNKWVASLPPAILTRFEVKGGWFGLGQGDLMREAEKRLPQVMEVMESMIETYQRFKAYQAEVQAMLKLGISFHEWLKLAPSKAKHYGAQLIYITPEKPL